jgi:hypothetical protein
MPDILPPDRLRLDPLYATPLQWGEAYEKIQQTAPKTKKRWGQSAEEPPVEPAQITEAALEKGPE